MADSGFAREDPRPQVDCGRQNCKILNPVDPTQWCRACLLLDVERYRERDRAQAMGSFLNYDY